MAAAKKIKIQVVAPKAPPRKRCKSASKSRSRSSAAAQAPLVRVLQSSTQRVIGPQRPIISLEDRTAFQYILSSDAEAVDRQDLFAQTSQSLTRTQDQPSAEGSEDSRESWEKDIKRWEPGQRPPLRNHPYDMWNNRPTARYGKGGWRPPASESKHGSDVEASASRQDEEANNKSFSLRLRGGWIDDEDLGSAGSTVAYETSEVEVTDEPSSEADSKAASEQDFYFGDVQTVRRPGSYSSAVMNICSGLTSHQISYIPCLNLCTVPLP